ncbi:DnaJ (Hsp40), sub C, member 17 [Cladochytrium tenue]|nr:DnaJ (Hsp40), sub C, member 17 [Cladochytrium tenue]
MANQDPTSDSFDPAGPLDGVDLYALLAIDPAASARDVQKAYRKTALKYHPDKVGPEDTKAARLFLLLARAVELLTDPAQRAIYDQSRAVKQERRRKQETHDRKRAADIAELERREELAQRRRGEVSDAERRKQELQRLREEGLRRLREMELADAAATTATTGSSGSNGNNGDRLTPTAAANVGGSAAAESATNTDADEVPLVVRWKSAEQPSLTSAADLQSRLTSLGADCAAPTHARLIRPGRAIAFFVSREDAERVIRTAAIKLPGFKLALAPSSGGDPDTTTSAAPGAPSGRPAPSQPAAAAHVQQGVGGDATSAKAFVSSLASSARFDADELALLALMAGGAPPAQ